MTGRRAASAGGRRRGALLLLGVAAACGSEASPEAPLARTGRLGSLRDLVLFERPEPAGGPFFLDLFEVTRADWVEFEVATGAPPMLDANGAAAYPAANMTQEQARAFATWRYGRLPRADEWAFAATIDGKHPFPWGGSDRGPEHANVGEFGLGEPMPVGTFESGRRDGEPYDLIGNVSEWTETPSPGWFLDQTVVARPGDRPTALIGVAMWRARRHPALSVWTSAAQPWPETWLLAVAGDRATAEIVGADFSSTMAGPAMARAPRERASTIGMRVATSPRDLLAALCGDPGPIDADAEPRLQRFLTASRHRPALAAAWPLAMARLQQRDVPFGPLAPVVARLLGVRLPGSRR